MSSDRNRREALATAMARNVAAWTDSSVTHLGIQTSWTDNLWSRQPGGSPVYLSAILINPHSTPNALQADLHRVQVAWRTKAIFLWDCWGTRDLRPLGYQRIWVEPWYLRPPSPPPRSSGVATPVVEEVTDAAQLGEFEAASWEGFEMSAAARRVGQYGQHARGTLQDDGMHYLMVRVDGRVVASSIVYITEDMLGIYGLSTIPGYRRRGYATSLVRASAALREDLPASVQPDPATVGMYAPLGFAPAGHIASWKRAP